jgi:Putative adhesin
MPSRVDRSWPELPPKSPGPYARLRQALADPRARRPLKLAGLVGLGLVALVGIVAVVLFVTRTYRFDSATYPSTVRRLAVDADTGEVSAIGSDRNDTIALWQRRYSVISPRVQSGLRDGTLQVRSRCPAVSFRCEVIFASQVPRSTAVSLVTRSAPVSVQDLSGPVAVTTRSGEVTVAQVAAPVSVDTGSGPVTLTRVRGEVAARTVSSPIELVDVHGRADLSSQSGSITGNEQAVEVFRATTAGGWVTATFVAPPRRVEVRSGSGEVDLHVPAGRYRLDLHGASGRVHVEGVVDDPAAPRTITVTTGGGIQLSGAR